jgi:aspartate-semialdehyde dehydrogenase
VRSAKQFAELVTHSHPWVNYVRNNKQESVSKLTPAAISGSLQVGIGRYKKMSLNNEPVYSVLTVGDQLLWGGGTPAPHVKYPAGQNIVTVIRGKPSRAGG